MPKIVDKKEKARLISDAALKVFRDLGYARTRMVDISEAAGIGKGTLYEYFKNKADILRFAFEQYFSGFIEGALWAMSDEKGPSDRLLSLVEFSLNHTDEWEDHCAVYVDYFGEARTEKDDFFSLARIYEETRSILKTLIQEGQQAGEMDAELNPEATAEILLSLFDGIIFSRIFEGHGSSRELIKKTSLRIIENGLLKNV